MKITLHPGAEQDIQEAAAFYEREGSSVLAARFVAEFKRLSNVLMCAKKFSHHSCACSAIKPELTSMSFANRGFAIPVSYLGRKDPSRDPELRGKADYILEVRRRVRWVLEAKAPGVELGENDYEQAWSYANHPERAA